MSRTSKPTAPNGSRAIGVGMYFVVAIFGLFVFFNISGLGTSTTVSYAFVAFAFLVLVVMPRCFPRVDADTPTTSRFLGSLGVRITTTYFVTELLAAAVFINIVRDSAAFAFFVQAGLYIVYLSYVAYQANGVEGNTPEARACARGKSRGVDAVPRLRNQASALVSHAAGTRWAKDAQRIEKLLDRGPAESFEGTLEIEQQIGGFLFELDTLIKENGDELTMSDCVRVLDMLIEQRNQICK